MSHKGEHARFRLGTKFLPAAQQWKGLIFGQKSGILDCVSYKRTINWFSFFVLKGLVLLFSLGPLQERTHRIFHTLSTVDPPNKGVLHTFIPIFGAKVVDKGLVIVSSLQVHLFHTDFSLSVGAYFIAHSWFVRTITIGEVRMVCLYGTLSPFQCGKAFTLLVLQSVPLKQRPHTAGGLPSSWMPDSSQHLVAR